MAPKKKGQKLALNDFLANDTLGSWADEMDALPTAPAPRAEGESMGGDFMSRPDARGRGGGFDDSRPPREELPLPTQAPWTAFVGNLAFDIGESDVANFFDGLSLNSVKIINDMEGKPKGFGYVEFGSLDDLKKALDMTGSEMAGRSVRVSVAEPPKGGIGGRRDPFASNAADEADQWRRSGPLPPVAGDSRSARPVTNRYENSQPDGVERDWSAARGSKFVPSAPVAERPARSGGFVSESAGVAEAASQWRSNKPVATAPPLAPAGGMARDAPPHQRGSSFRNEGPAGPADTESEWTRGGKFVPSVDRSAAASRRGSAQPFPPSQAPADDSPSDWRSSMRGPPSRQGSFQGSRPGSNEPSPQPAARRPLNLAARTASNNPTPSPSTPASPDINASPSSSPALPSTTPAPAKSNPFGNAKPVDASAREKAAEEKLAKQAAERQERLKKDQEAKLAYKTKEREFVRAPLVKGAAGASVSRKSSSPAGAAAPELAPAGKEDESKLGAKVETKTLEEEDDFKSVPMAGGAKSAKSAGAEKDVKGEEKKAGSAYAGLEIEGGDDGEEEELVEGVKKVEV